MSKKTTGGPPMATTKAQQKAVHKYVKAKYDRLEITMPKGKKDEIKTHAERQGESVNAFVNRAIDETMERDVE
jgi:predicted HicB family RNase H-like nuclease